MLFSDTYQEIENSSKGEYKEKGSKFIGYSFPVYSEEEIKNKLQEIRKKENSAHHHCYAFVLYPDKSAYRYNDDGEPSSTAGKPILRVITSNNLTNILIIVVRYFGGTKLGILGLIRSYKKTASNTIENGTIITKRIKEIYEVLFKYPDMNHVMKIIKKNKIEIIETNSSEKNCKIIFSINKNNSNTMINKFKKYHQLHIKYIKTL